MASETIRAKEGMVLTNGEIYAKIIILGTGVSKDDFYEITEEEYLKQIANSEEIKDY
jgi:hypothetical protein